MKNSKYNDKQAERQRLTRNRSIKNFSKVVLALGAVSLLLYCLYWLISSQPAMSEDDIISKNGIHWHPELSIYIEGVRQDVQADIGLGVVHEPVHTHDTTGTIHLEFQGVVTKDDIRLRKLFKNWGKEFNSNCIFDKCNGGSGSVKMYVNGTPNTEFENYVMQDKARIEIRYE